MDVQVLGGVGVCFFFSAALFFIVLGLSLDAFLDEPTNLRERSCVQSPMPNKQWILEQFENESFCLSDDYVNESSSKNIGILWEGSAV